MTAHVPRAIVVVWSAADQRINGPIRLSGTRTVSSAPTAVNATAIAENMTVNLTSAWSVGYARFVAKKTATVSAATSHGQRLRDRLDGAVRRWSTRGCSPITV